MTPKGVINMGIRREGKGLIGVLLGKVVPRAQKKRSQSTSLFLCPGQDSNLHELMLTTPSK